jgi:hypothetical protein
MNWHVDEPRPEVEANLSAGATDYIVRKYCQHCNFRSGFIIVYTISTCNTLYKVRFTACLYRWLAIKACVADFPRWSAALVQEAVLQSLSPNAWIFRLQSARAPSIDSGGVTSTVALIDSGGVSSFARRYCASSSSPRTCDRSHAPSVIRIVPHGWPKSTQNASIARTSSPIKEASLPTIVYGSKCSTMRSTHSARISSQRTADAFLWRSDSHSPSFSSGWATRDKGSMSRACKRRSSRPSSIGGPSAAYIVLFIATDMSFSSLLKTLRFRAKYRSSVRYNKSSSMRWVCDPMLGARLLRKELAHELMGICHVSFAVLPGVRLPGVRLLFKHIRVVLVCWGTTLKLVFRLWLQ